MDEGQRIVLSRESAVDILTGLFNHSYFQETLRQEVKKAKLYNIPVTLAFLNLDYFSYYNTLHGYFEGDLLLKKISSLLRRQIRESDIACRYDGDELAIIFPQTTHQEAFDLVNRIRNEVAINFIPHEEESISKPITLSIGLASAPKDAINPQTLIAKSQKALTQAKLKGKNQCHSYLENQNEHITDQPVILIVDDLIENIHLLEQMLLSQGYEFMRATDGLEALSLIKHRKPDLIILDVMMPNLNGYEACRRLKEDEKTRLIPVILITSIDNPDNKITGIEVGAEDYLIKPFRKTELIARVNSLIRGKRLNDQLENMENVLFSLAKVVEAKDKYTLGHTERVTYYACSLGEKIGLVASQLRALEIGGALHDIGKIGVPESILNKPGSLTPEEWEIIKKHPEIGYEICLPLKNRLEEALLIVRHHHEKINGRGYPDGLKGEAIPLVARVMAIADIYDALTVDRAYRRYLSKKEALKILREEAAKELLDQELVNHFEKIMNP